MVEDDMKGADTTASPHLGDEVFERLMTGQLTAFERSGVLRHLDECAECSRIYDGLTELERGARAFDHGVPAAGAETRTRPRRVAWVGLAAAAAMAVTVLLPWRAWLATSAAPPVDTLRGGAALAGPELVAPVGRVAAVPRFTWDPVSDALSYRVELYDSDAEPLWTSPGTTQPEMAWPPAVVAAPGLYYWRVVATVDGGVETLISGLEPFELTAPSD
jgi:hypothetical protein